MQLNAATGDTLTLSLDNPAYTNQTYIMVAGWSAFAGALALDHDTAKRIELRLIMDNPEHLEIVKEKYGEDRWDELVAEYFPDGHEGHGGDEGEATASADG